MAVIGPLHKCPRSLGKCGIKPDLLIPDARCKGAASLRSLGEAAMSSGLQIGKHRQLQGTTRQSVSGTEDLWL